MDVRWVNLCGGPAIAGVGVTIPRARSYERDGEVQRRCARRCPAHRLRTDSLGRLQTRSVEQISRFGGPEVLDVVDVPGPTPGPDQQLYDVSTARIDFPDSHRSPSER